MKRGVILLGILTCSSIAVAQERRKALPNPPFLPEYLQGPEKKSLQGLQPLDVQTMQAGVCTVRARVNTKPQNSFVRISDFALRIGKMAVKQRECSLEIQPDEVIAFAGKYVGMRLRLINATQETKTLSTCDGQLAIVQEAINEEGKWQPIEYLRRARCGNSYHRVSLKPGEYWMFAVPHYRGTFKTRLRFRLGTKLSNEFEGSVNPGQFIKPKKPPLPLPE